MKITEKRWHGAKYQAVDTGNGWNIELHEWCKKSFGKNSSPWDKEAGRWYVTGHEFWFREGSDLTLFLLRWA
jgi:hypothetical protein